MWKKAFLSLVGRLCGGSFYSQFVLETLSGFVTSQIEMILDLMTHLLLILN